MGYQSSCLRGAENIQIHQTEKERSFASPEEFYSKHGTATLSTKGFNATWKGIIFYCHKQTVSPSKLKV